MDRTIRLLCACYSILLVLHTRRLRDAYGAEMAAVLREQMIDELYTNGAMDALRAAGKAFCELVTIAVPARLNQERVAAFSLAICISVGLFAGMYRIFPDQDVLDPWMRAVGLQCR